MIDYLEAYNGGVHMYSEGGIKGWASTATGVAYILSTYGVAPTTYGSSSMDFASEYGFESDGGAMLLMKRAFELI